MTITITITNVSFVKITAAYIVPFYNPHLSMKKSQEVMYMAVHGF